MKKKTCKDCAFIESTETFSFCLLKDLYTETKEDDEACDEFIKD